MQPDCTMKLALQDALWGNAVRKNATLDRLKFDLCGLISSEHSISAEAVTVFAAISAAQVEASISAETALSRIQSLSEDLSERSKAFVQVEANKT